MSTRIILSPHFDFVQADVLRTGPTLFPHPQKAEVVKLRFFVGLSSDEIAELMGIALSSAKRDWAYSRGRLHRKIPSGG